MSKSNRTTAKRGVRRHPQAVLAEAIRLKLRPGSPVFAELYQVAVAEPEPDDLAMYLQTADARAAEFWQLVALAALRRHLGRAFTPRGYARLRRALAQAAPQLAAAAGG